jgi:hypothetical protein
MPSARWTRPSGAAARADMKTKARVCERRPAIRAPVTRGTVCPAHAQPSESISETLRSHRSHLMIVAHGERAHFVRFRGGGAPLRGGVRPGRRGQPVSGGGGAAVAANHRAPCGSSPSAFHTSEVRLSVTARMHCPLRAVRGFPSCFPFRLCKSTTIGHLLLRPPLLPRCLQCYAPAERLPFA